MYKLIYKRQFVAGFDADQVVGNLAQLLQLKPKTVRLMFLSERPSVIKILDTPEDVQEWRAAFLEAGVYLDVVSMAISNANEIADQIELELALHSIDDELEDEQESPRQLLVKKIIAREEADELAAAEEEKKLAPTPANPAKSTPSKAVEQKPVEPPVMAAPAISAVISADTTPAEVPVVVAAVTDVASPMVIAAAVLQTPIFTITGSADDAALSPEILPAAELSAEPKAKKPKVEKLKSEKLKAEKKKAKKLKKSLQAGANDASIASNDSERNGGSDQGSAAQSAAPVKSTPVKLVPVVRLVPAIKPAPDVKSEPAVRLVPAVKSAPVVQIGSAAKMEPAIKAEPEATPAPIIKAEPVIKPAPVIKVEPEVKPEPEVKVEAEVKPAPEVKPEPEVKPVPVVKAKPEIKHAVAIKAEALAKAAALTKPNVNAEVKQEVKQEVKPEVKPEVEVAAELSPELLDAQTDDAALDVDFHKSSFMWGMLTILLAILLTAATILWLKRPLWQPINESPAADKVESALATQALFALAHIDVKRLQQLPDVLQPESGMKHFPAPVPGFWRKLEQAGIPVAQQMDHAWVAAYRSNNQTQSLWVLTGAFDAKQIRGWLEKTYSVDEVTPEQIVFSAGDDNSCATSTPMMAVVKSDQIILGSPERVAAFRGRTEALAPAERDLTDWRTLGDKQMLSVAVFNPAQFAEESTAIALSKLSVDVVPVKGIYLGVAPRLFPPALEFDAVMTGADAQFINAAEGNIKQLVGDVKNTIVKDWPETLPLYEHMRLNKTEQQLQATVLFDERVQQQLQVWTSSLVARTFAMNDAGPVATEERLDEKPRTFSELPSSTLPDFASVKHLNDAFIAQATAGPFGVGIRSIDVTDKGTEITLNVNAFNLPNLGKDAENIRFRITDIVDHQDQSLLAASPCDTTGVRETVNVNLVYEGSFFDQGQPKVYTGIQGAKKILLPDTINLSSIGAIKGEIEYSLPVTVERVTVNAPLAGQVVNSQGMQLRFLSASNSRLYFQNSGNTDALLQINPLNAEGKALATINTLQGENLFNSGVTTSIDAQGTIAAAEVIVASKMEKQIYPFSFGRIQPPEKTFAQEKPAPQLLTVASLTALKKDAPPSDVKYPYQTPLQTTVAGPALIAVNQLNTQAQKLTLGADIYLHNQHPLTRQLGAARMVITELEDATGNLHEVNFQLPIALEHQGGYWAEGVYQPDETQPWLRGQLELREQDLAVSDVVALWGKLVFLAASEPIAIQVPFQFGMEWNGSGASLKLARWEPGRMLFDIQGSFPELMGITALDDNGVAISQAAELRSNFGVNQIELPVQQRPATIEFSIARNQEAAEFPFEIRVAQ